MIHLVLAQAHDEIYFSSFIDYVSHYRNYLATLMKSGNYPSHSNHRTSFLRLDFLECMFWDQLWQGGNDLVQDLFHSTRTRRIERIHSNRIVTQAGIWEIHTLLLQMENLLLGGHRMKVRPLATTISERSPTKIGKDTLEDILNDKIKLWTLKMNKNPSMWKHIWREGFIKDPEISHYIVLWRTNIVRCTLSLHVSSLAL